MLVQANCYYRRWVGFLSRGQKKSVPGQIVLRYAILAVVSNRYPATEEVIVINTILVSFIVTVTAGVTCHLICKWLDRHDRDNK